MPVKIKTDLKVLEKLTTNVRENFRKEITSGDAGYELIRTLQEIISKGISPVDGYGRFQRYSDSYRDAIKAKQVPLKVDVSPVNLYQTGDMMGSLECVEEGGKAYIRFNDEKAAYHQKGGGNLPQRKLLPIGSREKFNKRIMDLIVRALKKATKRK